MGSWLSRLKQLTWKKVLVWLFKWLFVVLIITTLSQLASELRGWSVVEPLLSKYGPYKISIEPAGYPQIHDDQTWVLTKIRNEGLRTISDLRAEYQFKCEMNSTRRASLSSKRLKRGESDSFEFAAKLNPDCSILAEAEVGLYKDKKTGSCYYKPSDGNRSVCALCEYEVSIYDGYRNIANLSTLYPFWDGSVEIILTVPGCEQYMMAQDINNLIYEGTVYLAPIDICTGCDRGELPKNWCIGKCKTG